MFHFLLQTAGTEWVNKTTELNRWQEVTSEALHMRISSEKQGISQQLWALADEQDHNFH